jgi:hypothetical protein
MRFLLFEEFSNAALELNESGPKTSMDTWTYLHRSPKENRGSIDRLGLQPSTNKVITHGLYTVPKQWDSSEMQGKGEDTYEVHLKRGSKVLWTDSDRPMDFVLGRFEGPFKIEWDRIVKELGQDPATLRNEPWFAWKEKFSRKVEEYLAKNGFAAIQQGGEVVIFDPRAIERVVRR